MKGDLTQRRGGKTPHPNPLPMGEGELIWPVLTVWQPWAVALVVDGLKDVENRSWETGYRGWVWIHAGLKVDRDAVLWFAREGIALPALVTGAVIGAVRVADCRKEPRSSEWHQEGQVGWYTDARGMLRRPVRCSGRRKLWRPGGMLAEVLGVRAREIRGLNHEGHEARMGMRVHEGSYGSDGAYGPCVGGSCYG